MQSGANLQMCLGDVDAAALYATLKAGTFNTDTVCAGIDCTTASSSEKSDQEVILGEIERTVGTDECNRRLRVYLQKQYNLIAIDTMQTTYYEKKPSFRRSKRKTRDGQTESAKPMNE